MSKIKVSKSRPVPACRETPSSSKLLWAPKYKLLMINIVSIEERRLTGDAGNLVIANEGAAV